MDFRINRRRVDWRVRSTITDSLSLSLSLSLSFSFALHSFDFDLPQTPIGFVFRNPDGPWYADGGKRRGIEFAAPPQRRIAGMRIPRERESNRSVSRSPVNYAFVFVHRGLFGARPGADDWHLRAAVTVLLSLTRIARKRFLLFSHPSAASENSSPRTKRIVSSSCAHLRDARTVIKIAPKFREVLSGRLLLRAFVDFVFVFGWQFPTL